MKKIFLLLVVLVATALPSLAQAPTCQVNFGPWTDTNQSQIFYNGGATQCAYFVMTYQVSGFSAVSIEVDSAVGIQGGPGSFGLFSGTVVSGSNPSTSVACATTANCTLVLSGVVGYFKVAFTSHTGNGSIQGTLQGYKAYVALGGNVPATGSGCVGTSVTPCVVDGVTAAGSPPTTPPILGGGQDGAPGNIRVIHTDTVGNTRAVGAGPAGSAVVGDPVMVGGSDGTNTRRVVVDAVGRLNAVGPAANAAAVTGNPVLSAVWDGTNVRIPIFCNASAPINISASSVIVTGVAAKKIYVCQIIVSNASAVDMTFQSGTGSVCATGTTNLTGAFVSVLTAALPFQSYAPLATAAAADDLCVLLGSGVSVQGVVTYAQF